MKYTFHTHKQINMFKFKFIYVLIEQDEFGVRN